MATRHEMRRAVMAHRAKKYARQQEPLRYFRQPEPELEPEPVKPVEAPPAEPQPIVLNIQFDMEQLADFLAERIKIQPPPPAGDFDIEPVRDSEGRVVLYRRIPKRPRR
jgi:hypothetical protein